MAGFIYYVPERTQVDAADAERLGLGYALAKVRARACDGGPDKRRGCIAAEPDRVPTAQHGYYPDRQTWRKIPGGDCWVGYETASPPGPEDLLRADHLTKSHPVKLADGRTWQAPIARSFAELDDQLVAYAALPQTSDLDEEGRWTTAAVVARYAPLWELACDYYDHVVAGLAALDQSRRPPGSEDDDEPQAVTVQFDFARLHEAAVEALSANYLLGPAECAALGLFTRDHARSVLEAAIDLPGLVALQKKSTAAVAG